MSDFKAKMHQNTISVGALPQTPLGSLQCSRDRLAGFKGLLLRGKEVRVEKEKGEEGKEEEREVLWSPKNFLK